MLAAVLSVQGMIFVNFLYGKIFSRVIGNQRKLQRQWNLFDVRTCHGVFDLGAIEKTGSSPRAWYILLPTDE